MGFFVGAPTKILLKGSVASSAAGEGTGFGVVTLSDRDGKIIIFETTKTNQTFSFRTLLKPGRSYRLIGTAGGTGQTFEALSGAGKGAFNLTMSVIR